MLPGRIFGWMDGHMDGVCVCMCVTVNARQPGLLQRGCDLQGKIGLLLSRTVPCQVVTCTVIFQLTCHTYIS